MTITVSMNAPVQGGSFVCSSGNVYSSTGGGVISGISYTDVTELMKMGCTPIGSSGNGVPRIITAGTTDNASITDVLIGWNVAATTRTENLPPNPPSNYAVGIKDVNGTCSPETPINVVPSPGLTIDFIYTSSSPFPMTVPYSGLTFRFAGNSNFMVMG